VILKSYSKVNLYLRVLNIRPDKFHNIETIFERINLYDKIILKPRRDNHIRIICRNPLVPKNNSNLCFRSAELLQKKFKVNKGVDITIIKNIPIGAGLGGGSGNAAAVLLGLNKLWKLNLTTEKLKNLASGIGSDVPFFIYDTPFAIGRGRGERIKPLTALRDVLLWHILVVPKIHVSTPLIYREWDRKSTLTGKGDDVKILTSVLRKKGLCELRRNLFNSLESITIRLYPEVKRVKEKLSKLGVKTILMSGSGPAVFGVVSSRKEAVFLCNKLGKEESSCRVSVVRTA